MGKQQAHHLEQFACFAGFVRLRPASPACAGGPWPAGPTPHRDDKSEPCRRSAGFCRSPPAPFATTGFASSLLRGMYAMYCYVRCAAKLLWPPSMAFALIAMMHRASCVLVHLNSAGDGVRRSARSRRRVCALVCTSTPYLLVRVGICDRLRNLLQASAGRRTAHGRR